MYKLNHLAVGVRRAMLMSGVILAPAISSSAIGQESSPQAMNSDETEVIQVKGIRGSLNKSLADKRLSDQVIDTINSEDIGKLPDNNIAEALQRVTGVQIGRDRGGQGSSFQIRGMSENRVEIDGRSLLGNSADSRSNSFTGISSSLFDGIQVIKSPSASDTEGSLGGTIRLVTRKPLSTEKDKLSGTLKFGHDDYLGEKYDPEVNMFASSRWDFGGGELGALINISYEDYNQRTDQYDNNGWRTLLPSQYEIGLAGHTDDNGDRIYADHPGHDVWIPEAGRYERSDFSRERLGIDSTIQFAPNDDSEIYLTMNYIEFDTETNESKTNIQFPNWENSKFSVAYHQEDALRLQNSQDGTLNDFVLSGIGTSFESENWWEVSQWMARVNPSVKEENQDQYSVALGGKYHGENWKLSAEISTGESNKDTKDLNVNIRPYWDNSRLETIDYSMREGNYPNLDVYFPNDVTFDSPEGWFFTNSWGRDSDNTLTEDAAKVDFEYELDSVIHTIKSGVRYASRNVERHRYQLRDPYDGKTTINWHYRNNNNNFWELHIPVGGEPVPGFEYAPDSVSGLITSDSDAIFSDGTPQNYESNWRNPMTLGNSSYNEYLELTNILFALDDVNQETGETYDGPASVYDESYLYPYDITEDTFAIYLQFDFEGDIGDIGYRGNFGARYVRTEADIKALSKIQELPIYREDDTDGELNICQFSGYNGDVYDPNHVLGATGLCGEYDIRNFESERVENTYNDFLPSANISFDVYDDMIVRLAAARVMSRPDPAKLTPSLNLATGTKNATKGNPYLNPYEADQFDLSYEWYFAEASMLSATLFYKDVKSFLKTETYQEIVGEDVDRNYDNCTVARIGSTIDRDLNGDGIYDPDEALYCSAEVADGDLVTIKEERNGESGTVKGIEIGLQHDLSHVLPSPFDGFGYVLNYTYTDAEQPGENVNPATGKGLPLPNLSENSYNAILYYEKYGFGGRLAYNYRDEYFTGDSIYGFPIFSDEYDQLDLSLNYNVTEQVSVFFSATNLTDSTSYQYLAAPEITKQYREYGRRYTAGISASF
ncbi:TonB-dependent receptor [Echinimonas agarilytica]|uniref:TonB-dependent receptor n=1 Tax=Echinimonas agarilytica TaxID=1215918 RepID=A0AA41W4E3_9GAMM|nr:TonB-dependent receptor [Echinimonas agarilytica]MCM2678546.1 TonB-dependent receptor [Echinimonas agarilytica]